MARQIVHRLLISIPALVGVLFLCFCLLQVVPADPAMVIAGPDAKPETIAAIRQELGLDRSIPVQFFEYIMRVMRGDLGRSIISNKMVSEELALTIGPTVELMLGAMLIAVPIGLTLGTLAAVRRGSITDRIIMAFSVAGVSMPVFFIGLILIQYVGFKWALLPFTGRTGPVWDGGLPSLILPAVTLGAVLIGPIARGQNMSVSTGALGTTAVTTPPPVCGPCTKPFCCKISAESIFFTGCAARAERSKMSRAGRPSTTPPSPRRNKRRAKRVFELMVDS